MADSLRLSQQFVEVVGVGTVSDKLRLTQQFVEVILAPYVEMSPDSDSSAGSWLNEASTTPLWPSIDEAAPSDTDYIVSSAAPSSDVCKIGLSNPVVAVGEDVLVEYRYGKQPVGSSRVDLTVDLMQGVAVIATWTHTNVSSTLATVEQTLTLDQVFSITDYDDLFLRFTANSP